AEDDAVRALLANVDDVATRAAADAERGVLAALGTGCDLPVGAYAQIDGDLVALRAFVASEDHRMPVFGDATGPLREAAQLGRGLGERLLAVVQGTPGTGEAVS